MELLQIRPVYSVYSVWRRPGKPTKWLFLGEIGVIRTEEDECKLGQGPWMRESETGFGAFFSVLGAIYQGFRVPFFFYAISCNLTPSETDSCGGTYSVAAVCIPYLAFSLGCFGTNDLEIPKSGQK